MFKIGEFVVVGNKGVCVVTDVTTLNLSGIDKEREYYILKPVYISGSTVYVPVDGPKDSMRRVMTKEEAKEFIHEIPQIPILTAMNDKLLEQEYRGRIRSNECENWVQIIKTSYERKQHRIEAGRKVTALDAKYNRMAEDYLYGELAIALDIPKEQVESYIQDEIEK